MYSVTFYYCELLGKWRGFFLFCFFRSLFFGAFQSYRWKKCQKQGSLHLKRLTMENRVLNICNNILTFYPMNFYIFYCPFFHLLFFDKNVDIVPVYYYYYCYYYLCSLYLPSLHCCVWIRDVTVSMCVCERMPWSSVNNNNKQPRYRSVLLSVPFVVVRHQQVWRIFKTKKNKK